MHNDLLTLVQEARNFLAYHHRLGLQSYPTASALHSFLHSSTRPKEQTPAVVRQPTVPSRHTTPTRMQTPPAPTAGPPPSVGDLATVQAALGDCTRCLLHEKRQNLVFGEGQQLHGLMVIGDWPGPADDLSGSPFQGPEGEMLTNMLKGIGLPRDEVFVTTLVKCQPPAGRPPTMDEIATCLPFLWQQIAAIAPVVICAMGPLATQTLLATDQPLTRLRGNFHDCHGVALMPTFHPRFLEKHPEMKKATWQDLLLIKKKLAK